MLSLFVEPSNLFILKGEYNIELPNIKIHGILAAHSKLKFDVENGFHFLSYILEVDEITIFHAGYTIPYNGQTAYFKDFSVDLALLPINGYQPPELEFEPNFSINEAIEFAK